MACNAAPPLFHAGCAPSQPLPQHCASVYLRRVNKHGLKVEIPQPTTLSELRTCIQEKLGIAIECQILFISSCRYECPDEKQLFLQNGTIVHVHERDPMPSSTINIFVQKLSGQSKLGAAQKYCVSRHTSIQRFYQQHISANSGIPFLMVESGRRLEIERTFAEQNIPDQSTLCLVAEEPEQTELERDLSSLFEDDAVQEPSLEQEKPKPYVRVFIDKYQDAETNDEEPSALKPNFKKKKIAPIILAQPPESTPKESQNEYQLERPKPAKAPLLPKSQPTEQQKMSTKDRQKLRDELRKLFSSEFASDRYDRREEQQSPSQIY